MYKTGLKGPGDFAFPMAFFLTSGDHAGTFKFFSPVNTAGDIVADVVPHFR